MSWTSEPITDRLWEQESRSPGLHVSDVLDFIQESDRSIVDPSKQTNFGPGWAEVGKIFEAGHIAGLIRKHPDRYVHGKEKLKDGLFYTPDFIDLENDAVGEVKCTWKSPGEGITDPKFQRWIRQLMSYCWCEKKATGIVDVLYLYGARFGNEPERIRWTKTFEPVALFSHWRQILAYAERLRSLKSEV